MNQLRLVRIVLREPWRAHVHRGCGVRPFNSGVLWFGHHDLGLDPAPVRAKAAANLGRRPGVRKLKLHTPLRPRPANPTLWNQAGKHAFRFRHSTVTLRHLFRAVGTALVAVVLVGCSTGRQSRPQPPGEQYLIKAAELEATRQANLYDAIRQIRPFWLTRETRNRSGAAGLAVYLDDQYIGGTSALSRLPIHATAQVRYMSPTEAQVRFGQVNGLRAAIVVVSARH